MVSSVIRAKNWLFGVPHDTPVSILKTMLPLRGAAILLVVLAHAVIMMLAAEANIVPDAVLTPDLLGLWRLASPAKSVILELCACAVPIFLFLSGYYTLSTPQTWKAIWSSCRKLLIPMTTWSLLAWALSWRKGNGWTVPQFVEKFFFGTTQTGYFFIILIIQFYVLAKWLIPAVTARPLTTLAIAAAIQLAVHAYDYLFLFSELRIIEPIAWILRVQAFPEQLFPRFLVSFTLGIWASRSGDRFRNIITERYKVVLFAAFVAALVLIIERGVLFRYAFAVLGKSAFEATALTWAGWKIGMALWTLAAIFLFFGWFQRRVPMKSLLDTLGKYSFQIFLLHGPILDLTRTIIHKFFYEARYYGFLGTSVLFVSGLAGPIALTMLIQRKFPSPVRLALLGS